MQTNSVAAGRTAHLPDINPPIRARRLIEAGRRLLVDRTARRIDARDPDTYCHCRRVSELASMLAEELGLEERERQTLVQAALLHDIGKLEVPRSTLHKVLPLTEEETDMVRQHPDLGYRMLEGLDLPGEGLEAIRSHHERFDGSGYPDGLSGTQIPAMARILAVADAYDAITSDRPYRTGRSRQQGLQEIVRCAGSHFDPTVVAALASAMGHRPGAKSPEPAVYS